LKIDKKLNNNEIKFLKSLSYFINNSLKKVSIFSNMKGSKIRKLAETGFHLFPDSGKPEN